MLLMLFEGSAGDCGCGTVLMSFAGFKMADISEGNVSRLGAVRDSGKGRTLERSEI